MDHTASEHLRSPASRRALRLLASEPLPPPPVSELLGQAMRRPGELHEALPLSREAADLLAREAAACGLDADVLGTLVLEVALVASDLEGLFATLDPPSSAACDRAMPAAEAAYLRTLTIGRRTRDTRPDPPPAMIAVPVRLLGRLHEVQLSEALTAVAGGTAIGWEIAALIEGRTLAECVLLRAAQATLHSASPPSGRSTPALSSPSKTAR